MAKQDEAQAHEESKLLESFIAFAKSIKYARKRIREGINTEEFRNLLRNFRKPEEIFTTPFQPCEIFATLYLTCEIFL